MVAAVGGSLTEDQAKTLILKKLFDLAAQELTRYMEAEKRLLREQIENLWDKYALSCDRLEKDRADALRVHQDFLKGLGYV